MTPEERSHALGLAEELLGDIELDRLPLDKLLLKGARLARLSGDSEFVRWVSLELTAYGASDFNGKYWLRTFRGDKENAMYAGAAQVSMAVATLEAEFRNLRIPDVSGEYASVALGNARQYMSGLRNLIIKHKRVITAVSGVLHDFVSKHFYLLSFSQHQGSMFDTAKGNIDAVLVELPGEALRKIDSAYSNIRVGDPESISGAMNSVRRLIDGTADALFPATDETRKDGQGNVIKLGDQQRLNRLKAYIDDHAESKSRADRLKRAVSDIYGRVSSGVHNDVAASEAEYLFLSTYVLLGEITAMRRE